MVALQTILATSVNIQVDQPSTSLKFKYAMSNRNLKKQISSQDEQQADQHSYRIEIKKQKGYMYTSQRVSKSFVIYPCQWNMTQEIAYQEQLFYSFI